VLTAIHRTQAVHHTIHGVTPFALGHGEPPHVAIVRAA
jgi:hypothetical protein